MQRTQGIDKSEVGTGENAASQGEEITPSDDARVIHEGFLAVASQLARIADCMEREQQDELRALEESLQRGGQYLDGSKIR